MKNKLAKEAFERDVFWAVNDVTGYSVDGLAYWTINMAVSEPIVNGAAISATWWAVNGANGPNHWDDWEGQT